MTKELRSFEVAGVRYALVRVDVPEPYKSKTLPNGGQYHSVEIVPLGTFVDFTANGIEYERQLDDVVAKLRRELA